MANKKKQQKVEEEKSLVTKLTEFLIACKEELKKVSWPNKEQLKNATRAVIILSIMSGIYIGIADGIFRSLYEYIIK